MRFLPVALLFGTFAWSFVYVSLPVLALIGLACVPAVTLREVAAGRERA
ncbi:MAG TPA: hypothetical protein VLF19_06470 [Methylomirabilota bacterium]|nr:hypothetical protein [Methylomirabilota bacterium]